MVRYSNYKSPITNHASMAEFRSKLKTGTAEFAAAAAQMRAQVEDLSRKLAQVRLGGDAAARARHQSRGKLLARDRIRTLLDADAAWLELSPLPAGGRYDGGG